MDNYMCNVTMSSATCGFCANQSPSTSPRRRSSCALSKENAASSSCATLRSALALRADAGAADGRDARGRAHAKHGHCFSASCSRGSAREDEAGRKDTLNLLIPLESDALPFGGARRNVKIIKMLGHLIFPWAERLMWVDAKLAIGSLDPLEFYESTVERREVCASFMGLPTHANTFGKGRAKSFATHGETILRVSKGERVSVTDSAGAVRTQVRSYTMETNNSAHLTDFMIDSAYMAWNFRSPRCQRFNAALGCWWLSRSMLLRSRPAQLSVVLTRWELAAPYTDPGILTDLRD